MTTSPASALQKAVVAAIRSANTEAGQNVFDKAPSKKDQDPYPRVTIDGMQTIGNRADCYDGSEIFITFSAWGRPGEDSSPAMPTAGFQQVERIAYAARQALDDAELALDGHILDLIEFSDVDTSRDPDGITRRARMTLRAMTQPAD